MTGTVASVARCRVFLGAACLAIAGLTAGCLDVDESIVLNKDLTGRAGFKVTMDMEPFANQMLQVQRTATGKSGPPTAEDLAGLKEQMAGQLGDGLVDVESLKKNLPPGVTLVGATQKAEVFKLTLDFTFAFKDLLRLPEIALPGRSGLGPGGSTPMKPFEDLAFKDEGTTILITSTPTPAAAGPDAKTSPAGAGAMGSLLKQLSQPGAAEMMGAMQEAIKGIRLTFRLETPLTVVESNATGKDGTAMVWEKTFDHLARASVAGPGPADVKAMTVLVRVRK
jgi:hypothetical protein